MRVITVGLGIQGQKRSHVAGKDTVTTVDPVNPEADYRALKDIPLDTYDAALVCVPDKDKNELLTYLLSHGKHVLVEKPLVAEEDEEISRLANLARSRNAVCYTAYNHRFEPHFVRMKQLIESEKLGNLYLARLFYGNGTARDVRNSPWRDKDAGVLPDLGSHLLDTVLFWFGEPGVEFRVEAAHCFENQAFDHVSLSAQGKPVLELEATLVSWRNHFTADVYAERGSAHIESLCKWGPTTFTVRTRVLPSGRPPEEAVTLVEPDPTWRLEYEHFKQLCAAGGPSNTCNDIWLNQVLRRLSQEALAGASG